MIALRFAIVLSILLFVGTGRAQQLSPFVVSTSGGFYSNTEGMLSFTAGEMVAIETYTGINYTLTQGFQQNWELGTSVDDNPNSKSSFGVFPNPSDGYFNLVTETENNLRVELKIFNVLGIEIYRAEYFHQKQRNIEEINLSQFGQGMFIVTLSVRQDQQSSEKLFIEKINVIQY